MKTHSHLVWCSLMVCGLLLSHFGMAQSLIPHRIYSPSAEGEFLMDIDNDTFADFLYTSNDTNWYLHNDGMGNFATPKVTNLPMSIRQMADIDHDGDLDGWYAYRTLSNRWEDLSWYENDGSDTVFIAHPLTTTVSQFFKQQLIDINNDTWIDVVAFESDGYNTAKVWWLLNDGTGNFTESSSQQIQFQDLQMVTISDLHVAHLDSDEHLDFAFLYVLNDITDSLYMFKAMNDGTGNFSEPSSLAVPYNNALMGDYFMFLHFTASSFADVNQDGYDDLLLTTEVMFFESSATEVFWYLNENGNAFAQQEFIRKEYIDEFTDPDIIISMAYPYDMNRDGLLDVVVKYQYQSDYTSYYGNVTDIFGFAAYLNQGNNMPLIETFSLPQLGYCSSRDYLQNAYPARIDSIGADDWATFTKIYGQGWNANYINNTERQEPLMPIEAYGYVHTINDFDNNGQVDWLFSKSGRSYMATVVEDSAIGVHHINTFCEGAAIYPTDLEGDGDMDIIQIYTYHPLPGGNYYSVGPFFVTMANNGIGTFEEISSCGNGIPIVSPIKYDVIDFDNNGRKDIVFKGDKSIRVGLQDETGDMNTQVLISYTSLLPPGSLDYTNHWIGDLDNDGRYEIVLCLYNEGEIYIAEQENGTIFSPLSLVYIGDVNTINAIDVDADGKKDIIAIYEDERYILHNDGNNSFSLVQTLSNIATSFESDFNNDGYIDLLVNQAAGDPQLYLNNQTGSFSPPLPLPSDVKNIVYCGNIDGAHGNDIFYKDTNNVMWLRVNNGSANFESLPIPLQLPSPLSYFNIWGLYDVTGDNLLDVIGTNSEYLLYWENDQINQIQPQPTMPSLLVSPNPAQQSLQITLPAHHAVAQLRLTDMLGKASEQQVVPATASPQQIRLSTQHLPNGLYILSYQQEGAPTISQRVVVLH